MERIKREGCPRERVILLFFKRLSLYLPGRSGNSSSRTYNLMPMRLSVLLSAVLLYALPLSASGQETAKYIPDHRLDIRAGWGAMPFVNVLLYGISSLNHLSDDKSEDKSKRDSGIATGDLSLDIAFRVNRRMSAGVDMSWQGYSSSKGGETASHTMNVFSIMPQVTVNYLSGEKFTLYGKAEAGAALYAYDCSGTSVHFAFQLAPIGVTFGRRFYGFAELSAGLLYQGGKVGVGFRF